MGPLFLAFVLLPFIELYLLIRIGKVIGAVYTILGIIVVGIVGAYLAKREGLKVLRAWQDALREGRMPEEGLLGSALIVLGGLLLITPGVLSDVAGLALLLPWTRRALIPLVRRAFERRVAQGTLHVQTHGFHVHGPGPFGSSGAPRRPEVIDTEGEEV